MTDRIQKLNLTPPVGNFSMPEREWRRSVGKIKEDIEIRRRWKSLSTSPTLSGGHTFANQSWVYQRYRNLDNQNVELWYHVTFDITVASGINIYMTLPVNSLGATIEPIPMIYTPSGGNARIGSAFISGANQITCRREDASNWAVGNDYRISLKGPYRWQ